MMFSLTPPSHQVYALTKELYWRFFHVCSFSELLNLSLLTRKSYFPEHLSTNTYADDACEMPLRVLATVLPAFTRHATPGTIRLYFLSILISWTTGSPRGTPSCPELPAVPSEIHRLTSSLSELIKPATSGASRLEPFHQIPCPQGPQGSHTDFLGIWLFLQAPLSGQFSDLLQRSLLHQEYPA